MLSSATQSSEEPVCGEAPHGVEPRMDIRTIRGQTFPFSCLLAAIPPPVNNSILVTLALSLCAGGGRRVVNILVHNLLTASILCNFLLEHSPRSRKVENGSLTVRKLNGQRSDSRPGVPSG